MCMRMSVCVISTHLFSTSKKFLRTRCMGGVLNPKVNIGFMHVKKEF